MTGNNALADKSMSFAIRIVNCYKFLVNDRKEFVMSKQMLRCGTSIGANIHESIYAQSKADFISKLAISLKEASETTYWLQLMNMTDFIDDAQYKSMRQDADEIIRLLISSIKTTRKSLNEQ